MGVLFFVCLIFIHGCFLPFREGSFIFLLGGKQKCKKHYSRS